MSAFLRRRRTKSKRESIERKRRELSRIKDELRTMKEGPERKQLTKRKREKNREIFQLKWELRAAKASGGQPGPSAADGPETGALPDFIIIGEKKCGTTSLYHLLTQHPHVEPAALKEPHFFIEHFEEGIEWYRRCFPPLKWKGERRSITGEATPKYLSHPLVPERMAEVVPQARLIALLRNPVDRAYSDYQQMVSKGLEPRTFEEAVEQAIEAGKKTRPLGEEDEAPEHEERASRDGEVLYNEYLSRGTYVDHLVRWSEFFGDEQLLVLKSEDFFEHPQEILKRLLNFLDLPDWEPETWEIRKKGVYEQRMDPTIRRRLEDYFEPHNRRLYEYLGVDFGW